jgi:hypothetical protein
MAGPKKKQHFVPQFYLRGFTHDARREHLFFFDKTNQTSRPCNVEDIAQKRFFYDIAPEFLGPNADEQMVENFLDDVEGVCAPVLADILRNAEATGLTDNHIDAMAFFIVFQIWRTPEIRERMDALFRTGPEAIREFAEKNNCPSTPDLSILASYRSEMASILKIPILWPVGRHNRTLGLSDVLAPCWKYGRVVEV